MKAIKYISMIASCAFLLTACGGGDKLEDNEAVDTAATTKSTTPDISEEVLADLIQSFQLLWKCHHQLKNQVQNLTLKS